MTAVVTWGVGLNDTPTLLPSWGYGLADAGFSPPIEDATQGRLLARGERVLMTPSGDPSSFEPTDRPQMLPEDDTIMEPRDEENIFEPVGDPVVMTVAKDVPVMVPPGEPTVFLPDDDAVFEPDDDSPIMVVPENPSDPVVGDPE